MVYFIKYIIFFAIYFSGNSIPDRFEYRSERRFESLELRDENTFKYVFRNEFLRDTISGVYKIIGDSIILTSINRSEDYVVTEAEKGDGKIYLLDFKNYKNESFHYDLFLCNTVGEETRVRSQWNFSEVKKKNIKSFYIIETKGVKSPVYFLTKKRVNIYKIKWSGKRVFQNETWFYDCENGSIVPKGYNKESQKYSLKKVSS